MTTTRQARYVVRKADHVGGAPIPEDEPVLVIRAQDRLAAQMMDYYLHLYEQTEPDPVVWDELQQHQAALAEWQATHPTKFADR